jgi:exodeoxyribonuclease X
MRLCAVDTETTGMRDDDEVVEIAAVWGHTENEQYSFLVKPEKARISYGAMATHHITEDMVRNAESLDDTLWLLRLDRYDVDDTVLVFHNAEYDRKYLPAHLRELPYICTYRCALNLVPDAESHSNGALWYELGLSHPMPKEAGSYPHRALFDAIMTWDLVGWMMAEINLVTPDARQHLIDMTQRPVLLRKVRFGKHQGSLWEEVPVDYLQWCLRQDFDEDVIHTCRHWIETHSC